MRRLAAAVLLLTAACSEESDATGTAPVDGGGADAA
jgi:hypothetical protein